MRRRKTKLQVKRGKMLGVWGEKCRFISLQSQSFDWCPPCTCFSIAAVQKCQYSGGGAWLWRKFYVYLPFSNTLMVTTRKWCCSRCVNHVCRKERRYLEAAHLFPLHRIFFLPTGAEHFPLVLTSFFHRGVTSDLEFALTRLCSSQLFPQKSSPAQNWKGPHMCYPSW